MATTRLRHLRWESVAKPRFERAPLDVVDQLAPIGTATVHEAIGRRGYIGPHITLIQQGAIVAGTAVTVLSHPGDNMMIHAAVEQCHQGDILVVVNTAPSTMACSVTYWLRR